MRPPGLPSWTEDWDPAFSNSWFGVKNVMKTKCSVSDNLSEGCFQ